MTIEQIISACRTRRKKLRITQLDLAELSGVSLRTVKAIEKGSANPTLGHLVRILESLGLAIDIVERVRHE